MPYQEGKWQRVEGARQLWSKGEGWWEMWLACGHGAAVLHGATNPTGKYCKCFYKCGLQRATDAVARDAE